MVIHLANRSVAYPVGFIEGVLVRVGKLIFPVNFYVLDMEEGFSRGSIPIILGRPFMKTTRTKIDVYASEINTNLVVDNVVGVVVRLKPLNVTAEIEIGDSIESTVFYSCQVIGSSSFFLGSCEN